MSVLGSIFPDQPIDPVAVRQEALGKLSYGKTVAALMRQNALEQANQSAKQAADAAAQIRVNALTPALEAMQEGHDGLNGVRASIMNQIAEPFNDAVQIGKDIGAIKNPPRPRKKPGSNGAPVPPAEPEAQHPAGVIPEVIRQPAQPIPVGPLGHQPSGTSQPPSGIPPSPVAPPANCFVVWCPASRCFSYGCSPSGSPPQPIANLLPGCSGQIEQATNITSAQQDTIVAHLNGQGYSVNCESAPAVPPQPPSPPPVYPPPPQPPQPPQPPIGTPCPPPCPPIIDPSVVKCICDLTAQVKRFVDGLPLPVAFLAGKAGSQTAIDGEDQLWSGEPDQVPLYNDPPADDSDLVSLKYNDFGVSASSANGNGSGNGSVIRSSTVRGFTAANLQPTTAGSAILRAQLAQAFGTSVPSVPSQSSAPSTPDPATVLTGLLDFDWNQPNVCVAIVQLRNSVQAFKLGHLLQTIGVMSADGYMFGWKETIDDLKGRWSVGAAAQYQALKTLNNLVVGIVNLVDDALEIIGTQAAAMVVGTSLRLLVRAVNGFIARWLGFELEALTEAAERTATALAPREIPTAQEAHEAYLTGQIDHDLWQCWVMANDQLPIPAEKVMQSRQERLADDEIIRAWLRGLLYAGDPNDPLPVKQQGSFDTLRQYFRQRGWLNDDYVKTKVGLAYEVPTPSDLIHMMLRHVEDESIVKTFDLYAEYDKTYKGTLKDWFQMQGVPDAVSRRLWAAHWANMPFGQLQEMLFRLRPEKYGNAVDDHGYPIAVTADQIYQALRENDVPPFWRGKLIEIKYALPRLIDTRNAFNLGFQDENQYVGILKDRGQREEDIPWLVKLAERRKRDTLRKNDWVKEYIASSIPAATMQAGLTQDGYTPQEIQSVQQWADIKRQALSRKQCLAGLRRQYLRGRIDRDNLILSLQGLQYEPQQIQAVVTAVTCEFNSRDNSLTRAQVQKLAIKGLITPQDALARLMRLGMSQIDAALALQLSGEAARPKGKKFTLGQICDSVVMGRMQQDEALQRLGLLGYSPDDGQKALDLCIAKKSKSTGKKK